ncbi:TetR family transcriptional regulator [Streptomyces lunaelactis]|uniref:TetR family transcriptional regulator n=1 Tax=Streptomyces lunaelactis TaxID=1535768 RepID=UPI001585C176|nr:TetR family transcriptional regulator [Streptomyces lunaelactis]NUK04817.1 TetR family transcriptional regulator [Streptomyces lunaelactis]NUK10201.1 TetR family transcriptional regulator [Streptomyces lunaelactis]NUK19211.1 TetR family transcriptional regulator [Streptomyces lunaelactis]NUK26620.1 TetR family transcriptional regulator [Streptomyces lunaelactis]NUK36537.1 TetR family transcriptional regulator [Streptomyces lunaelactis]
MTPEALTPERILEATEDVLRRYGPAKATVVDVARALGVSHGSVYRHFRTKAALREAVTSRWLERSVVELAKITNGHEHPAPVKLRSWLTTLFEAKRHKAGDDPELFATYGVLIEENSGVVEEHIRELVEQVREIIEEGVLARQFAPADPGSAAQAVFDATSRFHDPAYAPEWQKPSIDDEFAAVLDLLLRGLSA